MSDVPAAGILYLVPTPIGNLEDLTFRAVAVFKTVDLVAAEDTRTTRKLFTHFGIRRPLTALHDHTSAARVEKLVEELVSGRSVALVSEAGTPGLSDPGYPLIRQAIAAGISVVPLPGACAAVTALTASGLPLTEFHFAGFLPVKDGARRRRLQELAMLPGTLILYESPRRMAAALTTIAEVMAAREVCIARELTKLHEEFIRGPATELAAREAGRQWRGEITILIAGAAGVPRTAAEAADVDELVRGELAALRAARPDLSTRDLVAALKPRFPSLDRRRLYDLVLREGGSPG
ncbi:MAG: 16S rRNA (cytidine(1402)-2'-O)-methyltransferase [Deltaproteobacteria bacterium]|nr:16S rRNA (cytidine(1402)-2'-O)-methyltransferase [Candidatus Anaeroferrophillacea bacterium]